MDLYLQSILDEIYFVISHNDYRLMYNLDAKR